MDKKIMDKLEDGFCEALHHYAEKGFDSPEKIETVKAALSGMVKLKMLEEMEEYGEEGMSGRRYYEDGGMSSRRSYHRRDSMGRYADGGSYRRSRESSYEDSYDGGMSGHDMRRQLERMIEEADSEKERQALRMAMQRL